MTHYVLLVHTINYIVGLAQYLYIILILILALCIMYVTGYALL